MKNLFWTLLKLGLVLAVLVCAVLGFVCTSIGLYQHRKAAEDSQNMAMRAEIMERAVVYVAAPADHPPATILVGPFRWTVKFAKLSPGEFGDSYYKTLEFRIASDLPPDQVRETLMHELTHACMFVGGGGTSGPGIDNEAHQLNDQFIEEFAPTMVQVMRDNPELVKWFQGK